MIAGKVAGVQITSNGGAPGSGKHDPHPWWGLLKCKYNPLIVMMVFLL